jgi:hypothetical protein
LPQEPNKYPLEEESYNKNIEEFISSGKWEFVVNKKSVVILSKR